MLRPSKIVLLGLCILCFGCASSSTPTEPGLRQISDHIVVYAGVEISVELNYRWANNNMGDEWMILQLSLSGGQRRSAEVSRDAITLRSPRGTTIPLPQPNEFRRVQLERRFDFERADAWAGPATFFSSHRAPCGRWLFSPPGGGLAFEKLYLTPFDWCSGPIAFQIPGGYQPGEWVLKIDLEEERVRVPFLVGVN
jgi:hypothetical protein